MKKYFLISILCLLSLVSIAQTSTLPTNFGKFNAFRNNPISFTLNFPTGYVFPTTTAETWDGETNTSQKVSTTPSVSISSNVLTIGYTAAQIRTLSSLGRFVTYVVFTDTANVKKYVLAANITVSSGSGAPSSNIINVNVPEIGNVSVNLLGETGLTSNYVTLAQTAATTATTASTNSQTQASISIAKATEATNAATSATNTVKFRQPYGLSTYLRSHPDTTYKSFYITDKGREGVFVYNSTSSASDDSSMVIISGGRRFLRVYESIKPEYFGADPTDLLDDYIAIQKSLNLANDKGIKVDFSEGVYYISNTLKPKLIGNGAQFKLLLQGKGRGRTILQGMSSLSGKNLIEYTATSVGNPRLDSDITIEGIDFIAKQADRCIYANYISGIQINDCKFIGGEICGVQLGDGTTENYSVYLDHCYFNGNNINSGQNLGLLRLYNSRYAVVTDMVGDGGKYAIELWQSDKSRITSCHLEGAKTAEIFIRGSGGGQHIIEQNLLGAYGLFDPSGNFDGTICGILVQGESGGCSQNSIKGNIIVTPTISTLDKPYTITAISGTIVPSSTTNIVTGSTSSATARLMGYNVTSNRIILQPISGTLIVGENITQAGTGGVVRLDSAITPKSYGLRLLGVAGSNIINTNQIVGEGTFGIIATSDQNNFSENNISTTNGMHLTFSYGSVLGNRISSSGIAIQKDYGSIEFTGNFYTGTLVTMCPQQFSSLTTAEINALSPTWPGIPKGLTLFDTTVSKMRYYNGSLWKYITPE